MADSHTWFMTYEVDLVNHKTKKFSVLIVGQHPIEWLYEHRREYPRANTVVLFFQKAPMRFASIIDVIDKTGDTS